MKNKANYSLYKCPYTHLGKDCGHELKGPEGYENTYSVWCACGFRGPVFYLNPEELGLELITSVPSEEYAVAHGQATVKKCKSCGKFYPVSQENCYDCN